MKRCTKCLQEKPPMSFNKMAAGVEGLAYQCRECAKAYANAHPHDLGVEGREALNERARIRYAAKTPNYRPRSLGRDPENKRASRRRYRAKRTPAYVARRKRIEKRRSQRRRADPKRKEYEQAKNRRWRAENPEKRRAIKWRRRVRLAGVSGQCNAEQWKALVVFFGTKCVKCSRWSRPLTLDHIVPISLPGSSHNLHNLQPLCGPCNSGKRDTYADYRGSHLVNGMRHLGWTLDA